MLQECLQCSGGGHFLHRFPIQVQFLAELRETRTGVPDAAALQSRLKQRPLETAPQHGRLHRQVSAALIGNCRTRIVECLLKGRNQGGAVSVTGNQPHGAGGAFKGIETGAAVRSNVVDARLEVLQGHGVALQRFLGLCQHRLDQGHAQQGCGQQAHYASHDSSLFLTRSSKAVTTAPTFRSALPVRSSASLPYGNSRSPESSRAR